MAQYCSVGEKGKVSFKLPNKQQENVISQNCPIEVISNQLASSLIVHSGQIGVPCYRPSAWLPPEYPADWIWNSFYASPKTDANELASFSISFEADQGELLSLNIAVDNLATIIFNGNNIGQASGFAATSSFPLTAIQGTNTLTFNCINTPVGTTSPTQNPAGLYFTVTSEKCQFYINDTTGQIYSREFRSCPTYEVSCGDECPQGYLKCNSTNYPGYCCIPCKEIAQRINNLTARIK